jgi:restriction system protein
MTPQGLPAPPAQGLVGRDDELSILRARLLDRQGGSVCLIGPPGVGKTALATEFARKFERQFTGGTTFINAQQQKLLPLPTGPPAPPDQRRLVIVDEIDLAGNLDLLPVAIRHLRDQRNVSILLTSRYTVRDVSGLYYVPLGPLSRSVAKSLSDRLGIDPDVRDSLIRESEGIPLTLSLLLRYAKEGNRPDVLQALGLTPVPTILGPDGRSLAPTAEGLSEIEATASGVSDSLIQALAANPQLMYSIDPRKFEELVADLYARAGYEVELTNVSRDGGVDIYAIQRTVFGSFLTVIDCKRYRKDRPVQVGLVRQLLGTVEAHHASVGVLATTSYFTSGAKALQRDRQYRLGLQDYLDLHEMLRRQAG